ncbi:MAG: CBS domain-containing protein [Chthoniobacterales bacterium]
MKICAAMTPDIEAVTPDDTLGTAAQLMADLDCEALPVSETSHLIGLITCRDIAMRVAAERCNPKEVTVGQAMSGYALYCFENEPIDNVAQKMADWWVRHLPVVNRDKRLIGRVSLADVTAPNAAPRAREVDMRTHRRWIRTHRRKPARSARQAVRDRGAAVAA